MLKNSRQAFNNYLKTNDHLWKYQTLDDVMFGICYEDKCNNTHGRIRMCQALQLKQQAGVRIPDDRTVYHRLFKNTDQERLWVRNIASVTNLHTLAYINLLAVAAVSVIMTKSTS